MKPGPPLLQFLRQFMVLRSARPPSPPPLRTSARRPPRRALAQELVQWGSFAAGLVSGIVAALGCLSCGSFLRGGGFG